MASAQPALPLSTRIALTDEGAMLLETAVQFFRERSPVAMVRAQLATETGFERAVWDEMVALGWSGLAIPAEYGGSGLTLAEAVAIAEPMGRHLFASPFTATQLFVEGLRDASDAQRAEHLPKVCAGAIGAVALFEPEGNWDLTRIRAQATVTGPTLQLSGTKTLVTDAAVADLLLVSVAHQGAPALVVLQRADLPTTALRRETVIDETRRVYCLDLSGISVSAERLIPRATRALAGIRDAALLLFAAEAAGGIAGVLELTVEYLNTRSAFGRKIGSFQALKHTCADILIGLERSRSHVYHAATCAAQGADVEIAVRMAKAQACDAFAFAGDRAVQFHGGFGFTYECDAQLYLRRALWLQYAFGDAPHQRKQLAPLLLGAA